MKPILLLYHRIACTSPDPWGLSVTPEHFAEHLDAIRRHARPVGLDAAASNGGNSVVVTFDDGYADNFTTARPLLERFDVPATVFVTTGCLDRATFWWDELCGIVFDNTEDASWRAWDDDLTPTRATYRTTWESLRTLGERERRNALDAMRQTASDKQAASSKPRPLTTNELIALSRCPLVELGCHTRTHPVLSALDPTSQRQEIAGSRQDLESLTGRTPTAFSYPYGHRCDYSAATVELVREAGYQTACAIDPADGGGDRLQLARIQVDDCDGDEFSRRLSRWLSGT